MSLTGYTHTCKITWTDGSKTLAGSASATADSERYIDQTIPGTSSNVPYSIMFNVASLKAFFALASVTVTLTFVAADSAHNTSVILLGGIPQQFVSSSVVTADASPLFIPHDVVGIKFSNATSTASDVNLRFLLDSTVSTLNA